MPVVAGYPLARRAVHPADRFNEPRGQKEDRLESRP